MSVCRGCTTLPFCLTSSWRCSLTPPRSALKNRPPNYQSSLNEQVGSSMDRELKLSKKGQTVKEVWMGDVPLDIKGYYEPQGVVDEANLSVSTGPTAQRGHTGVVRAVAVLPDGDIVSGSSDRTAIIWSPDGTQKQVLKGHTSYMNAGGLMAVAVLPDGDIVTGSEDRTAIIWSPEGEKKKVLRGHTHYVLAVAVFPNGDIVTGSNDNTAIIWTAEGEQKRVLKGRTGNVNAVAVLPDGGIVTGSSDNTAII